MDSDDRGRALTMVRWQDISVVMVVRNEAERLPWVLRSLPEPGEIVVVDGGSHDGTPDVARRFGCRVVVHPFRSFVEQKRLALRHATRPWVFNLDADERPSLELVREIADTAAPGDVTGFWIPVRTYFLGKWVRHCGWYPAYKLRLVRRDAADIQARGVFVHERWGVRFGQIRRLRSPILHVSYRDLDDVMIKVNRYTTLGAWDLWVLGVRSRWYHRWLLPVWSYFQTLILRQGVRDGWVGFWVARMQAWSTRMKYWKLWEIEKRIRPEPPPIHRNFSGHPEN